MSLYTGAKRDRTEAFGDEWIMTEKSEKRKSIRYTDRDKRIIRSCYTVWDMIKSSYNQEELKELGGSFKQGCTLKDRYISSLFFHSTMTPVALFGFARRYLTGEIIEPSDAWESALNLVQYGHTFGTKNQSFTVDEDPEKYEELLEKYAQWSDKGEPETRVVEKKNNSDIDSEDEGLDSEEEGAEEEGVLSSNVFYSDKESVDEEESFKSCEWVDSDKEEEVKLPNQLQLPSSLLQLPSPLLQSPSPLLQLPSPLLQSSSPLLQLPESTPQVSTQLQEQLWDPQDVLDLIKLRLNIVEGDFSQIDWKSIISDNESQISRVKGIWDAYLLHMMKNQQGSSEDTLLVALKMLITPAIDDHRIDWEWIAKGLTSSEKEETSASCMEKMWSVIKTQNSTLPTDLSMPLKLSEKERVLGSIKAHLYRSKGLVSKIDWKWVAHDQTEAIGKSKAIWNSYLLELYTAEPNRQDNAPIMKFFGHAQKRYQPLGKEFWEWISAWMSTKAHPVSVEQCQELWQQQIVDRYFASWYL